MPLEALEFWERLKFHWNYSIIPVRPAGGANYNKGKRIYRERRDPRSGTPRGPQGALITIGASGSIGRGETRGAGSREARRGR